MSRTVSEGGIAIHGDATPLPFGEIVQLGPELLGDILTRPHVGDVVLFDAIGAIVLSHVLKDHVLIEPDNVLAILEGEEDNL